MLGVLTSAEEEKSRLKALLGMRPRVQYSYFFIIFFEILLIYLKIFIYLLRERREQGVGAEGSEQLRYMQAHVGEGGYETPLCRLPNDGRGWLVIMTPRMKGRTEMGRPGAGTQGRKPGKSP